MSKTYKRGRSTVTETFVLKIIGDDGSLLDLDDDVTPIDPMSLEGYQGFTSEFNSKEEAIEMLLRYPYEIDDIIVQPVLRLRRT